MFPNYRTYLTEIRDAILAAGNCFQQGFAPARADGNRIWTWPTQGEPQEIGPSDHLGAYFYLRLRGGLRYRNRNDALSSCSESGLLTRIPLRLVAVRACSDPFVVEAWLRNVLQNLSMNESKGWLGLQVLSAEIDPLRVYRLERGNEAPVPDNFFLGKYALVSIDLELEVESASDVCAEDLNCNEIAVETC